MLPLISVIIPVYKVEEYLEQCVDSVTAQTYDNLEIILVDDGSPDRCGEICDEYALADSRIKVIHKENSGLSDARNAGLDIARGEYIGFVDSDDRIEPGAFRLLYDNLIKYNADISVCEWVYAFRDGVKRHNNLKGIRVFNCEEAIGFSLNLKYGSEVAWNKLYKKTIFDNLRYPYGKYVEDAFVLIDVFRKARLTVYDSTVMFYYRQRKSSLSGDGGNPRLFDLIEAHKRNFDIIEAEFPNAAGCARAKLLWAHLMVAKRLLYGKGKKNYIKLCEYKRIIFKNILFIIKNPYMELSLKSQFIVYSVSIKLYKLIFTLIKKNKNNNCFD